MSNNRIVVEKLLPITANGLHFKSCYYKSLELAKEYDIHTIAFPAISTGAYGYPINEAAVIALSTIATWLSENPDYGMAVIMVCYDQKMLDSYQRVLDDVHHK